MFFSSKIGTMPNGPSLLSVFHFVCCSRAGGYGHSAGNCMGSNWFPELTWKCSSRILHLLTYCRKLPRARDAWARKQPWAKKSTKDGKEKGERWNCYNVTPETAQSPPGCRISTNITSLVWAWNRVKQVKGSIRQILVQEQLGKILPPVSTWASKPKQFSQATP